VKVVERWLALAKPQISAISVTGDEVVLKSMLACSSLL
jgi:hypothetical protein